MARALFLLILFAAACEKAPDPAEYQKFLEAQRANRGAPHSGQTPMFTPDANAPRPEFVMPVPESWTEVEPDMAFFLKKWELEGGGNCTVSWNVGSIEANLERWLGQFETESGNSRQDAEIGQINQGHYPAVTVKLRGKLLATRSVGGGPPREDWMLYGAILPETPAGEIYIKVLGPRSVIESQMDELLRGFSRVAVNLP